MRKIEKEIKKKSTELIESSLPEISSLDNIQTKTKKPRNIPLLLVPFAATITIAVIMIPVLLKQVAPAQVKPTSSMTSGQSSNHSSKSDNHNTSSNKNTYHFNFENYKPAFSSFDEVAYYSYFAFQQGGASNNGLLQPHHRLAMQNEEVDGENEGESSKRERYIDEYGRLHYPIPYDMEFVFQDFLYFEFDTVNNDFLEQRIGNGHIYGLSIKTNILNDETILILKRGEHFYSCLSNGAGSHSTGGPTYVEFSSHKTIEGFDVVKDSTNKRYLTINCGPSAQSQVDYASLSSINIEGNSFTVDPASVFYDPTPISCDLDELKRRLGNDPNFEIVDNYGGPDALVYDASSETNTFTLEEFEGTFSVSQDKLYLDETEILALNGANKIYASEINKDGHRDLVFESLKNAVRRFNVYDIYHNKYLYSKSVLNIGEYEYYLAMRDNHLVVNLFEPGLTDESYLLDYGYFAYGGNNGATIVWQNLFELSTLCLTGVFEADGETPVEYVETHFRFNSGTSYIIEMQLPKFSGSTYPDYPSLVHQIKCTPSRSVINMPNQSPTWTFLSRENDTYRYQITFQEKGYSYYTISFYRFNFSLRVAVDEPVEAE